MTTLANLEWVDGKSNPAGIKSIAYFIRKSDIKQPLPVIGEDGISYTEDIVPATGKMFQTIYTTQGNGKVTFEQIGSKDGYQPVNKATLSYPDINDNVKAFVSKYCNANMVFVIPHYTVDGVRYAVFGLEVDATTTIKGDSGDKPGSQKGTTIEIESPDVVALPNYKGVIPLETGSLNCDTNVFTPKEPAGA